MEQFKRHVAYKVNISQILGSEYIREEDQWAPSYFLIGNKKVSRVNLFGVIVAVNDNEITVDDSTGRILLRSFDNNFSFDGTIGDAISIVGRPREYNNERYIVPEILKKIDTRWLAVRKQEIPFTPPIRKTEEQIPAENEVLSEAVEAIEDDPSTKVMGLIKALDAGNGVETDRVISESKIESAEKIITNLLKEGEIYEVKPGRVKVLE